MEKYALAYMIETLREVHIKSISHVDFIKTKQNILMVFDPTKADIGLYKLPRENLLATTYCECKEELPQNATQ